MITFYMVYRIFYGYFWLKIVQKRTKIGQKWYVFG
jgi:hypothetical protein